MSVVSVDTLPRWRTNYVKSVMKCRIDVARIGAMMHRLGQVFVES